MTPAAGRGIINIPFPELGEADCEVPVQSETVIRDKVGELRRRIRLLVMQRWIFFALFCAALACALLVIGSRLQGVEAAPEWLGGLLPVGVVVGTEIAWTR